ncbi:hypothetical protein BDV38DRAFT_201431 [Aspergillus pseudotamarii]|uniref:Uncharacterized protein n=1 Tax=Aspergillus pseudotamarii TaxID=132259 RepID=A0A5N6SDI3_ASPPS|nr:uncharacterized protein BDV38DRAFT_201431 [Aspergillus pseudotamarii]KAE8132675.1 hypothetical protein BDV38DRAFT_201431 [Aspergillus pseudotamarii]
MRVGCLWYGELVRLFSDQQAPINASKSTVYAWPVKSKGQEGSCWLLVRVSVLDLIWFRYLYSTRYCVCEAYGLHTRGAVVDLGQFIAPKLNVCGEKKRKKKKKKYLPQPTRVYPYTLPDIIIPYQLNPGEKRAKNRTKRKIKQKVPLSPFVDQLYQPRVDRY